MFIALTGGIGCGKSRALSEFSKLGFQCCDADKICHEFYNTDAGRAILRSNWPQLFDASGNWERRKLGEIVFRDPEELNKLEALVHPYLEQQLEKLRNHPEPVMVEIPLLFEKKLDHLCDAVVAVWSSLAVRRTRLAQRGWDRAECARRERLQWSPEAKLAAATYGIINQRSIELLEQQCKDIAQKILRKNI